MKRLRFAVIMFSFILSAGVFFSACSNKDKDGENDTEQVDDGGTEEGGEGTEEGGGGTEEGGGEEPDTSEPEPTKAETQDDGDDAVVEEKYPAAYTLVNTEGKYENLSIGPMIATYNVLDYGADPTGQTDNTLIFQGLINELGMQGAGTLYIPEGLYRVNGSLRVKKGVTIRGDWQKPDKDSPIEGTVLLAYVGRGKDNYGQPFIETEVGAGIMDLAIFYPEQDPNQIVSYSPAFRFGVQGYFGNEYNNVKNVTMVNAYTAALFNYTNGGASPVVNGLYGTPLFVGVEVDRIADVGRVEFLDFAPDYWINCGLYEKLGMENPFTDENAVNAVKDFIYNNGTGLIMRRNDWSYASYLKVDGYRNGYKGSRTVDMMEDSTPNGHNYDFYFTNCMNGVYIEATNVVGILFNKVIAENCETGIRIGPGTSGAAQFANCTIDAENAVYIDSSSSTRVLLNESVLSRGKADILGGTLQATDVDFNNKAEAEPHIFIGSSGRVNVVGCRFNGEADIVDESFFTSHIDHTPLETEQASEFPQMEQVVKTPAKFVLYIATDPEFGAVVDDPDTDNTAAVQKALDKAAADGGGYVYLPAGKYRFDGSITIPTGVELIGSMANSSVPHGEGSILGCYFGANDQNALPFIQMQEGAGLRGITIDYPLQIFEKPARPEDYKPDWYPYSIQGQGKDIYIINVGIRAAYAALDLFTYQCDNFYVDFLAGHMFNVGVRVGGNSENGLLSNLMCNTIIYACGQESKFGGFMNSPVSSDNGPVYQYAMSYLEFLILGDCKNLTLYNCFNYGSFRGIKLVNDGNGGPQDSISMGLGLDGDTYTFYVAEGVTTQNFDFINTQVVTLTSDYSPSDTSFLYSEGNNSFDINLFTSDYWGAPRFGVYMGENSGTFRLETAHFNTTGDGMLYVKGGNISIVNGSVNSASAISAFGSDENISIKASTVPEVGINTTVAEWEFNIPNSMSFSSGGIISTASLDHTGWTLNASHNPAAAVQAIDRNVQSRWDTAASQAPGQWFTVDLGGEQTFNYLILDVGSSTGDGPVEYAVYVSDDGVNWGEAVASGQRGNGIIQFDPQTASHIKIEQNGSGGLYWSIHELYVCNVVSQD